VIRLMLRLALLLWIVSLAVLLIARSVDGKRGDPSRGSALYNGGRLACTACHGFGVLSVPPLVGIASRIAVERLAQPGMDGETVALYLAQSILDPNRYLVPGFPANNMPHYAVGGTFGLSWQELNDLVAYLMTL
jgi:hypothetical protein